MGIVTEKLNYDTINKVLLSVLTTSRTYYASSPKIAVHIAIKKLSIFLETQNQSRRIISITSMKRKLGVAEKVLLTETIIVRLIIQIGIFRAPYHTYPRKKIMIMSAAISTLGVHCHLSLVSIDRYVLVPLHFYTL